MATGGRVIIKIDGDDKEFQSVMSKTKDTIGGLNKAFAAVGAAGIAGLGAATKVGMDFESQMSSVQAISGATAADMELLTSKAKEMGIESAFSATESGKALEYMAMAGWKTEDMLGGLEGVMNLAAASGEDLGMVSDIVTDSMTAFGLSADQSGRFADVLAAASSNANTNVAMMGETFKYVAPVAGSLGFLVEDTAVAIGLMANAGIKGSQAGTVLRSTLTRLAKPTKESQQAIDDLGISLTDQNGQIKPFNALLKDLRASFSTLTDAQKAEYAAMLAGQEGMSGMLALVNASETDFNKLTSAINDSSGAAKEMADVKLDNLKGQLTLLGSSFEGLGIAIYEKFGGQFQEIVEAMIGKINAFIEALSNGELDGLLSGIATGITVIGTALLGLNVAFIIQDIINVFNGLQAATQAVATAQALLNAVMAMNPFVLIAMAVAALVAGLIVLWNTNEGFRNAVIAVWEAVKNAFIGAWEAIKPIWDAVQPYFAAIWEGIKGVFSTVVTYYKGMFSAAWEAIKAVWNIVTSYFQAVWETIKTIFSVVADVLTGDFEGAWEGIKSIVGIWADFFRGVWDNIKNVFAAVGSWFGNTFQAAYNAVTNVWNNIKAFFSNVWQNIKSAFHVDDMVTIGKNLIQGLIDGIHNVATKLYEKAQNIVNKVKSIFTGVKGFDEHSPSKWSKKVIIYLGEGMVKGFDYIKDGVVGAAVEIVDEMKSEEQKALDSMNETMLESEYKYLSEKQRLEDEAAAKALQKKYDDAEKELIQAKEKAKDAAAIQEAEAKYAEKIEQIKQDEINDTQKKEQDAYLAQLKETADREKKIYEARQKDIEKAKQEIKDAFQDLADAAFDSIEEIEKAQTSLADKLKDFGDLYTTKTIKYGDGSEREIVKLADIEKQTKALQDYADKLQAVKERGEIPQEFFSTLRDLSVEEGTKFANALLKADDKAFNKYIEDWKTKQEKADEISKMLYADEAQQAKDEIEQQFNEFDADLTRKGKQNAEAWGAAFLAEVKNTMPKVMNEIYSAFNSIVNTPSFAVAGGGGVTNNYTTYTEKAPQIINTSVNLDNREFGRAVYTSYQDEAKRLGK